MIYWRGIVVNISSAIQRNMMISYEFWVTADKSFSRDYSKQMSRIILRLLLISLLLKLIARDTTRPLLNGELQLLNKC